MIKIFLTLLALSTFALGQYTSYDEYREHTTQSDDGVTYGAEATALFARMTVQPSDARKALIDGLISDLKSAGVWSKLDAFYMFAGHSEAESLLNWIENDNDATLVNSPTFTVDRGFTGNGSSSYINTNFAPSADATNYSQDDCAFGVYLRLDQAGADKCAMGIFDNTPNRFSQIFPRNSGNNLVISLNAPGSTTDASTATLGLFAASRASSTTHRAYRNGVEDDSEFSTSGAVNEDNFYVLARHRNDTGGVDLFSNNQAAFAFLSSDLIDSEHLSLSNLIEAYLDALGAGVI